MIKFNNINDYLHHAQAGDKVIIGDFPIEWDEDTEVPFPLRKSYLQVVAESTTKEELKFRVWGGTRDLGLSKSTYDTTPVRLYTEEEYEDLL